MCPLCLSTIGLVVASAVSTGGLAALAVKLSQKKNREQESTLNSSKSTRQPKTRESAWHESETNQNKKEK